MRKRYIIPANFMESGYVANGTIAIRNLVEAGIIAVIMYFICKALPLPSGIDGIPYYIFIIAPLVMISVIGVQGDPLSVFVYDFLKWQKRRKPYFYSTHNEAYTQEAADRLFDAPQFRDTLADMLDKLRSNVSGEEISYVEGETFVFAQDPEQEALKFAQEEIIANREEEFAKAREAEQKRHEEQNEQNEVSEEIPFEQPKSAGAVNAAQIAESLVLDELDWEEDDG